MAGEGRVGFCIDESLGRTIAPVLRQVRAPGAPDIHHVSELGLHGTTDEVLLHELGQRNFAALVTKDSRMLRAATRQAAWQGSGICLFVADGKWGNLPMFEQARQLLWWWPAMVAQAQVAPMGGAWQVTRDKGPSGLRRLLPVLDGS